MRVQDQIAERVEKEAAGELGPSQHSRAIEVFDAHEARLAATVRNVDAAIARLERRCRSSAGDEQRVGALHERARRGVKLRTEVPCAGRAECNLLRRARLNLRGAVAEAPVDLDLETARADRRDTPIHPVASARRGL